MKKILLIYAIVCLMFAASSTLNAVDNGIYNIKVTVVEASGVSISITGDTLDLGYVVRGSSVISAQYGRTIVKNIGGVNITLKMKITSTPWTVGTTSLSDTGTDKFVLATVFELWDSIPAWSWFATNDVLTEADKTATDAAGGIFADVATDTNVDGYDIGQGGEASNFYLFNTPTELSNADQYGAQQTIQVTVTAFEQT